MNANVQTIEIDRVIMQRRTVKPAEMNGRKIDDGTIHDLLALADWAPTHARTEPWRFIVFGGDAVAQFARSHAELYRDNTDNYMQAKYDNLTGLGNNVSHIILAWMKRVANHKIPETEEIAATSAAIENILLGATARGIASFWSTGGMTYHRAFHDAYGLGEEDKMLGILYLGYTNEPFKKGARLIPLSEKIEWVK